MANLYLVARNPDGVGSDEYDSFIVACESEEDARTSTPKPVGSASWYHPWKDDGTITVTLVGTAKDDAPAGTIILASFNAG